MNDTNAHLEFAGMTVIVTGGSSGIGLATADLFASRGAAVAVFDPNPIPDRGVDLPKHDHHEVDVVDQSSIDRAVGDVLARHGRADVVVNNAGISAVGTVEDNDDAEWHRVLDVHVIAIARMARATMPALRAAPAGAIVNTCSVAATAGLPNRALYSAAKGAIAGLTRAMAADAAVHGIRVNAVAPGTVDTPWVDRLLSAAPDPTVEKRHLEARQPLGRLGTADEVAEVIAFLASPRSSFTTGSIFETDGGMSGLRLPPPDGVSQLITRPHPS